MNPEFLRAARSRDVQKIKDIIAIGKTSIAYETTHHGNTALHMAARFGLLDLAQELIAKHPSLVLKSNLKGETPVHIAARAGNTAIVYLFIKSVRGFDSVHIARIKDRFGNTPLHFAVKNQHYKVVKAFADKDPESLVLLNDDGESPLFIAVDLKLSILAAKIIDLNNSTLDYRGHNRQTLLHCAAIRHELGTMNIILEKKPQLTKVQDDKERTPLHYAASLGEIKMVKLLLGYDTSAAYLQDADQKIPLHSAAENGQEAVLKALIDSCPDTVEFIDKKQQNILHLAAMNGNLEAVSYILKLPEMEDLVNSPDVDGNIPLHLAAINYHSSVVRLLSKNPSVEIRTVNNSNRTALAIVQSSHDRGMELQKHLTLKALKNSYKRRAINLADVSENAEFSEEIDKDSKSRAMAQTISVMATLIATFTFTAAFTLPGGLKSDLPDEGTALLITRAAFQAFVISDTIAMTTSITAAVIVFWSSSRRDNESFMDTLPFAIGLTWISLIAMALAFVTGLFVVLRNMLWLAIVVCAIGCAAPFFLYIFAPMFLLAFEKLSTSRASVGRRRNIVEDNPFLFIFRLVKMLF
ncbi:hypothetical protein COLO4_10465 [Corchorus olitorius]|uniref:PGG domain-containing protein n=1 Tax=Corchorus olitorius TaxID=93759 RepID=A0A1R3K8G7_9ROSI|nr:hypothetical protein COLO4_10465 [Corchorus olitorius]